MRLSNLQNSNEVPMSSPVYGFTTQLDTSITTGQLQCYLFSPDMHQQKHSILTARDHPRMLDSPPFLRSIIWSYPKYKHKQENYNQAILAFPLLQVTMFTKWHLIIHDFSAALPSLAAKIMHRLCPQTKEMDYNSKCTVDTFYHPATSCHFRRS